MLFQFSNLAWHMKGTLIWVASVLSICANILMIIVILHRHKKRYSPATIYAIIIAVSGIGIVAMEQKTFLMTNINPAFYPDWLVKLSDFSFSNYCAFLSHFFPPLVNLFVMLDSVNRYACICQPNMKASLFKKKCVSMLILVIVVVAAVLAALMSRVMHNLREKGKLDKSLFQLLYPWVFKAALTFVIAITMCIFQLVYTLRIRSTLKESIQFLTQSNAHQAHAISYKKIITFTTMVCVIFLTYNFVIMLMETGCFICRNLLTPGIFSSKLMVYHDFCFFNGTIFLEYTINLANCLKPFCYAIAYIWVQIRWIHSLYTAVYHEFKLIEVLPFRHGKSKGWFHLIYAEAHQ